MATRAEEPTACERSGPGPPPIRTGSDRIDPVSRIATARLNIDGAPQLLFSPP
ncbi:hypothetical protein K3N28_22510 [Glycomyces sp. TRM65418]|uniref:hypothetical protein n=1 Tax=Glycomyces sp. TRM65418 TaxID=2867006 RepID=UPI001CE59803|nr:hypothetical protein [Glycomyces sp. TRM65418]MCC3765836.1 hypothetical protein [Glycomyces sp. TRM65418]QZD55422.1 hypothetical protein K3N28_22390 [Glycomyces sp. TRM65418]